jgi:transposase InsO family protein
MYQDLGEKFEEKLLNVASKYVNSSSEIPDYSYTASNGLEIILPDGDSLSLDYVTSNTYSVLVGMNTDNLNNWKTAYITDKLYSKVLTVSKANNDEAGLYPQYQIRDGLIYFEDWNGNRRLCVPDAFRVTVMSEVHNTLTESAHGGHAKTYNRIASTYYWPKMSRDIKRYVSTCDICQKSKPRRHAPAGLLQPIPIPTLPFEVVSMDFIPELPLSDGFDNILVIVDKLTKYAIFIPTTTSISEVDTAALFFHHIISKFGIPRQVISDRDIRWRGEFWNEICKRMGMTRSLTTAYHPQADGQTEVLNQSLEISLRAYIGPSRNDWVKYIDALALSYNSTPHTATGFAPAYLLRGYTPVTGSTLLHNSEGIPRPATGIDPSDEQGGTITQDSGTSLHPIALEMTEAFLAERHRAQEALVLGQHFQRRSYNRGRLALEFAEGDLVLLNPHSLSLLRNEPGRGRKLLMKYDGPFEVIQKLSLVSYRLRMPESYGIHPILNIAHLEKYQPSPSEFGNRPTKNLNWADFNELPEYEVDCIIAERCKKGRNGRRVIQYLTCFKGFSADYDEWLTLKQLRNAPEILENWRIFQERSMPQSQ